MQLSTGECSSRTAAAGFSGPQPVRPAWIRQLHQERDRPACSPSLAASKTGLLGELGTGCGVGSAWLRSGAGESTRIVTAESDPQLAQVVAELFAGDERIEVVSADWTALIERGPFALLFVDAREAKLSARDIIADVVEPGGFVVLDDFTPSAVWPPMYEGRVDTLRQEWLMDKRFTTVEVMVAPDAAVLLATRH